MTDYVVYPVPIRNFDYGSYRPLDSLDGGSARRKAATYTGQHKHNKRRQTSMSLVGFDPVIPVLGRAKTFCGLGHIFLYKQRPFLGNSSVSTFPRQRTRTQE
jgi:hypothetical protein